MRTKLEKLREENSSTITEAVINDVLDYGYDDPKVFFEDVLQHGCQWGTVSSMIYYTDTHTFYDKFYNEIEDIRLELQEEWIIWNEPIDSDLKNYYAWLAYEHVAYNIYNQLDMEGR